MGPEKYNIVDADIESLSFILVVHALWMLDLANIPIKFIEYDSLLLALSPTNHYFIYQLHSTMISKLLKHQIVIPLAV